MTEAPERIWIEDEFGDGDDDQWTYGTWDVRNYRDYVVEYVRADLALPAVQPDREHVAFSMWKAEADRAAPNVGKHRIPLGFAVAAYDEREKWLGLADAAIRSMLETGKEVMPDVPSDPKPQPDEAPASTDDAGRGAAESARD